MSGSPVVAHGLVARRRRPYCATSIASFVRRRDARGQGPDAVCMYLSCRWGVGAAFLCRRASLVESRSGYGEAIFTLRSIDEEKNSAETVEKQNTE